MRAVLIVSALLYWAPSARAAPVESRTAKETRGDSYIDLDHCLKDKRCWQLIKGNFDQIFSGTLAEVEGAEPGHFFPASVTFAKDHADAEGHFLDVTCQHGGGARQPCDDERDELEERVVSVTLLRTLPIENRPPGLYDERDWQILPRGREYLAKVKKRHPDLWVELARLVRAHRAHQGG